MTESRLDDAARAAWLAYIGGLKQDEIARIMGISRQSAQRLVSQAMAAGLVKVRIDHPVARCMDLAARIEARFGLSLCRVVPSLQSPEASGLAVSHATGDLIEAHLSRGEPLVIGLGTGRTLRAAVEHMPHLDGGACKIVSLTGNISPDGSTAFFNVLFTIADKVRAATYPMPLPVIAASAAERDALLNQKTLATTRSLSLQTDVRFIGIGPMGDAAPLLVDGFITQQDLDRLRTKGAVGEIVGHVYDANGDFLDDEINTRVSSVEMPSDPPAHTIAAAHGPGKIAAIQGALRGRRITGLITDERTAEALLS